MPTGKNGNGLTLLEHFIPDGLSHAAPAFVESLKINSISEERRGGRTVVIKRRNIYGERGADLINFYFHLADIPIRYVSEVRDWRRWEASCFQMLNGDRFRAKVIDARTVRLDKLLGQSLWDHMNQGTLNKRMLAAAGVSITVPINFGVMNLAARGRTVMHPCRTSFMTRRPGARV